MGLAIVFIVIAVPVAYFMYLHYQEGKEHREYLKDDDRDDTERFYEDEVWPNAFKRNKN